MSAIESASNIRTDYLRLLVTQLSNQNPLEPMDSSEMTAQLTTLSQLEQLENMNSRFGEMDGTFQKVLLASQADQAVNLIGKTVSFYRQGAEAPLEGQVTSVATSDGRVHLTVGEHRVALDEILTIR